MAKKNKVKEVETSVVEPVIEKEVESSLEPVEDVILPVAEEVIEEPVVEIEVKEEKPVKKEKKEKEVVIEPVSMKDSFAKQIEKTPFVLYQNGLTICRWKPNVRITLHDDTFEMNGNHYKYSGVEIHHV